MIEAAIGETLARHEGITSTAAEEFIGSLKQKGKWTVESYSSQITKDLELGWF